MRLTEAELKAVKARFKRLFHTSRRASEGMTLALSPRHSNVSAAVCTAWTFAQEWDGPRDELELRLKEMEASILSDLAEADRFVEAFPPGTGHAFGHTSGSPSIDDQKTGSTKCHHCGDPIPAFFPGFSAVYLKLHAGGDILLFVMHPKCWDTRQHRSLPHEKPCGTSGLAPIEREEWLLLLAAKDVLSS